MPKGIYTAKRGIGKPFQKGHKVIGGFQKGNKIRPKKHGMKGKYPWNKGLKLPQISGENAFNWKGGFSTIKKRAKIRDDYTCQICGLREPEIMEADHIVPRKVDKNLEFEMENLMTLCPNCHRRKTKRDLKQYNLYKNRE